MLFFFSFHFSIHGTFLLHNYCSYKVELKLRFSSIFGVLKFGVSGLLMQIGHQARGAGGGGGGEGGSLIYIIM